jgi:hypothetical protein
MMGLPPSDSAAPRMKSIWPPMPEKMAGADGVRAHLAGQVDLDGAVDGVTLGFLRMMRGVVDESPGPTRPSGLSSTKS